MIPLQRLVDVMLDQVETAHPGIAYSITLAPENALLLPRENWDTYRGRMVWSSTSVDEYLVLLSPTTLGPPSAPTYYGDLRAGTFSTTTPA